MKQQNTENKKNFSQFDEKYEKRRELSFRVKLKTFKRMLKYCLKLLIQKRVVWKMTELK